MVGADGPSVGDALDAVRSKRVVLIVVTEWPSGTMAIKFGAVMRKALGVETEVYLVQSSPERIFRAETDVSETQFRQYLAREDVQCPGQVLFIELSGGSSR